MTGRPLARVVIAGAGVAALEAALALRELAGDRVDVELVAPEERFVYRPLLVGQPFGFGEPWSHDLGSLLRPLGVRWRRDALTAVDATARVVLTRNGAAIAYDALLVATGARAFEALPGALTFAGAHGVDGMRVLLAELGAGEIRSVAFAVPPGVAWPLPLYELALLTRAHLGNAGTGVRLTVVTPEDAPLAVFGAVPSQTLGALLRRRRVRFRTAYPYRFEERSLLLVPEGELPADRAVALPAYRGPAIHGLPSDELGFLPADRYGAVQGADCVYAAGDATDFPIKQGGIATQQADAAASAIAARLGSAVEPQPFRPVLRAIAFGGERPQYLRAQVAGGAGEAGPPRPEPMWWPAAKVAGLRLAPYLARHGAPRELPGTVGAALTA